MSTNGIYTSDDADMSECDGEKVVTMMDVLQEQEEFEEDANAVLGASDDKECTYSKGYIKRQAIYACLTCCVEAKDDPLKRAGVCLACSLSCHENHELIELYTKRNFRCDCGNPKFNSHPCQFIPIKTELNEENNYNQNFSGLYCTCHRPYPDPESTSDDEMIQCIVCEDWLHASHLEATIPTEQYAEMICKGCMDKNKFIHDYSEFAVNSEDVDIETVDTENVITTNGNSECGSIIETLPINDIDSVKTNEDNEKDEMEVDVSKKVETETKPKDDSLENVFNNEVNNENEESDKTNDFKEKENCANVSEQIDPATTDDVEKSDKTNVAECKESEADTVDTDSKDAEAETVGSESKDTEKESEADTVDTDSKDAEAEKGGSESNDTEKEYEADTVGTESKDAETRTVGLESTVGDDSKSAETETVGSESKDTEMGDVADTVGNDSNDAKAETMGSESKDAETAGIESKDIEAETEVIEPNTDNEKTSHKIVNNETDGTEIENLNVAEGGCTQSTKESSKITSDSDETSERSIETEITSLPEEIVEQSEEKDSDKHETKCNSEKAENITENIEESPENDVEMLHVKLDDSNNSNKMEINENVNESDIAETHSKDDYRVSSEISNNDEIDKDLNKIESASNGSEVLQSSSDQPLEKDQVSKDLEVLSNVQENKRKLSTEQSEAEDVVAKKAKLEESKQCIRPKGIKQRFRGATFWSSNIRQKFCTCNECITMYKDLSVLFLIDPEDTVKAYETLGKEKIDGTASQYEKGLQALSSLGRIQQINALTEYNKMRDKLLDFLKSFKERKEVVKEEDIKAFFAGMKPKREPDGVYFCR